MIEESVFTEYKRFVLEYLAANKTDLYFRKILDDNAFLSNKIFLCYPALFADALKISPHAREVKELAVAGYLYFYALLKIDDALDDHLKPLDKEKMLFVLKAHEEAIKILSTYFPVGNSFWQRWDEKHLVYFRNHEKEKMLQKRKRITVMEYNEIAMNRNAIGLIAMDCISHLKKDDNLVSSLTNIHNNFAIAYQVLDDIKDIRTDLQSGQINFAVRKLGPVQSCANDIDKLIKAFYTTGNYTQVYKYALDRVNTAIDIAEKIAANLWSDTLKNFRYAINQELYNSRGFLRTIKLRSALSRDINNSPCLKVSRQDGDLAARLQNMQEAHIHFLLRQKENEFGELRHIMFLHRDIGLSTKKEVHVNDTFQRAIIAEVFCDCKEKLNGSFETIVNEEIEYLLKRRQKDRIGGWSYYPSIPEIAPDADDLGQVLQVFINAGRVNEIKKYFSTPINILLRDRADEAGGIETWVIPKNSAEERHKRQERFNEIWGKGPDVEVVANFVYALALYDFASYEENIEKSAAYIQRHLEPAGYWKSKWYYGPYYGTYVCLKLLEIVSKKSNAKQPVVQKVVLKRVHNFLLTHQHADGGWGLEQKGSDLLSTSLALLALTSLKKLLDKQDIFESISRGLEFLSATYDLSSYEIYNIPFIQPRMKDPYSSKTITAAFVLKALIKCETNFLQQHPVLHNNSI